MFRLLLSILLVVAFAGASAASVTHGLNHGADHAGHHAELTGSDLSTDAQEALADCCDTTNGMGSTACFGDLVAAASFSPVNPTSRMASSVLYVDFNSSNLTLAVPTGPPKA